MKRDSVNRMFSFGKRDIRGPGSRLKPKKLTEGLNKVFRQPHVYQAPKSSCLLLLLKLEIRKHCSIYKYIYFANF